MIPTIRQKAIRKAILNYAEVTGSVCTESLLFTGCDPEDIREVLLDMYEDHDLERTTRGEDVRYHIPTQPR